ncbi:hypothetical protein OUZ56_010618 [Daphnia magna]|uniref:Uncharacterized protein n=1 Tax=Daphnia magna TaxID=35525 RepID=A0ABR0AJ26_9CRUS|nr:hypothetical protein OUZ56_010618 [Daphnia magna]
MLSQPAQTSMRCHPAHILFPIPSVPAAEDRNSLKTKAGVQYCFIVDNMEAESSEMGQVDTEEVDLGSQEAVLEDFTRKSLDGDTVPPPTMTYGRLVESNKPTPTNFRFTSVALGKNYKKLLGSETGKKMQDVIREASKRFPRPDPEKHLGYKNILVKAGKQLQVEEEK